MNRSGRGHAVNDKERPGRAAARQLPGEAEVVVVGGGPTGLATALELGRRGVDCVVVEPRTSVAQTRPRAKTTSIRTMEHFRRWGLARTLRTAAFLPVEWSQDIVFCVNLLGPEVARFTGCFGMTTSRSDLFAETSQQVPQFVVEQVLRDAVDELPSCTTAYGWKATEVTEDQAGATVAVVNGRGDRRTVRCMFAVGADGAGSVVRPAIGAQYRGSVEERRNLTAVFVAPGLADRVPHGPAIQYWVLQPGASAYMGRQDLDATWWIGLIGVAPELGPADVRDRIEAAIGGRVNLQVRGTDPWIGRTLNADRYASERLLLVGDAAHLNPPWGGHGFNTGIGDAVNAAWKLAAVLKGWGGPGLLASYERERLPIATQIIAVAGRQSGLLAADFADPVLLEESERGAAARRRVGDEIRQLKHEEFHALGLVLGYHYEGSDIVCSDGPAGPASANDVSDYRPTDKPGHRLPHRWLAQDVSLYDRLGEWFTVIRAGGGDPGPLVAAARSRNVPMSVLDLEGGACGAPLILVRPDQHVAWRGEGRADEVESVVDVVRGAGAGRPVPVQARPERPPSWELR